MSEIPGRRARTIAEFNQLISQLFKTEVVESSIRSYRPRADDVVITPYSKCGTTWLQQIFHTLRTGGDMDFEEISRVVPWIETAAILGLDLEAPQRGEPRGFKSHLSYHRIPKGARYIVSLRDPRDSLVSMYRFMEGWIFEPGAISIENFAANWTARVETGNDIWRHLLSWWGQRDNPDVLLLSYAQMIARPETAVRKIAAFCAIDLSADLLALTLERSSLRFMLEHEAKFDESPMRAASETLCGLPPDGNSAKVRQGAVGSHTHELTAELIAELDEQWAMRVTPATGFRDYAAFEKALSAEMPPAGKE